LDYDPNDPDAYLKSLQGWHEALEEEFKIASESGDVEKVREVVKKTIGDRMPDFARNLVDIADHAGSDSARLNAIKFAFEFYFGKDPVGAEDAFNKTLNELTKGKS
jgi:hypothetical protein